MAWGRSFAAVFDEAYANAPIRKATAAQRRLWLLGAEGVRAENTGAIWFQRNEFYAHWLHAQAGERLIIRFDLAAFHDGLHVYSAENAYLGFAPCRQAVGFFDSDLRAIKLVRSIARVPALRDGTTGKKRHGDHAIAVALAHWVSRMQFTECGYQAVPRADSEAATLNEYDMTTITAPAMNFARPWVLA